MIRLRLPRLRGFTAFLPGKDLPLLHLWSPGKAAPSLLRAPLRKLLIGVPGAEAMRVPTRNQTRSDHPWRLGTASLHEALDRLAGPAVSPWLSHALLASRLAAHSDRLSPGAPQVTRRLDGCPCALSALPSPLPPAAAQPPAAEPLGCPDLLAAPEARQVGLPGWPAWPLTGTPLPHGLQGAVGQPR